MKAGRFINRWTWLVILLVAVIIVSSTVIGLKYHQNPSIEISVLPPKIFQGNIFVGGEVNNPGFYPLKTGDSVEDIIRSAGGTTDGVNPGQVELVVSGEDTESQQKININRAEAWLLEALPGVGEVRARAIIEYRQNHGLFRDINELVNVPGLGDIIFEGIKDLVTVAE